MEILIGAVVVAVGLAVGLVAAASLLAKRAPGYASAGAAAPRPVTAKASAPPPAAAEVAAPAATTTEDGKSAERRADLLRLEERLRAREEAVESRMVELGDRERLLAEKHTELEDVRERHIRELERAAGMPASQARHQLLKELEDQTRHDRAKVVRQIEEETKRDADRRVRNILSVVMQRLAAGHAAETTVSVVQLSADDMKGRIIGREGRNIRALEHLTGVDFIIDDTPNAVILSGFDGVRREIARMTLEKLLQDGRIHPARIEETYYQAKSELEAHITECGEQACFDANVQALDADLVTTLGRLKYRTSYGQNVLAHSIECAHLAAMMAHELGASAKTARRAALLHDIGKAVSHEIEGPHALVGGDLARRHGESEAVAHAMEAHHNEVEPQTVEAVIVQAADALSGARPGARGESLEQYVKRLRDLEGIATRHDGVDKVYAMQAGREIRVMVQPGALDDDGAVLLSHEIAREIDAGQRIFRPARTCGSSSATLCLTLSMQPSTSPPSRLGMPQHVSVALVGRRPRGDSARGSRCARAPARRRAAPRACCTRRSRWRRARPRPRSPAPRERLCASRTSRERLRGERRQRELRRDAGHLLLHLAQQAARLDQVGQRRRMPEPSSPISWGSPRILSTSGMPSRRARAAFSRAIRRGKSSSSWRPRPRCRGT